jgi:hypothetical protein
MRKKSIKKIAVANIGFKRFFVLTEGLFHGHDQPYSVLTPLPFSSFVFFFEHSSQRNSGS